MATVKDIDRLKWRQEQYQMYNLKKPRAASKTPEKKVAVKTKST